MSRFNTPKLGSKTTNLAGGDAYKQTSKLELVSLLLTTFVNDTFYRSGKDTQERIKTLVSEVKDKEFVAKTAIYARDKFNMRTGSHIVAGEIAGNVHGEEWLKSFYNKIIVRPDDMLEVISYVQSKGYKLPNALKKGFALALQDFSEYEIGKYKKASKKLSLVDVVNLVHPKPTEAITKLVKGTLENPETWEVLLTQAGSNQQNKMDVWYKLVTEKKLGLMALIRNLRNLIEMQSWTIKQVVDKEGNIRHPQPLIPLICQQLTDPEKIAKSRMLPFRFFTALDEVQKLKGHGVREVTVALSQALDISLKNVPKLEGKTLVVVDESGSMDGKPAQIASMFAATLVKANPDCELMTFANDARYQNINPLDSTTTIAKSIDFSGGGTNFHSIFQTANKPYDRIIILSDMQGWLGTTTPVGDFNKYKAKFNCNPKVYSWDLENSGTMQFAEGNVCCLAGWSDKVFDIMALVESDGNALVKEVEKVEL